MASNHLAATRRALGLAALALLWASAASAQLTQPDGAVIPAGNTLNAALNSPPLSEGIDVRADASLVPEVFTPTRELIFSFIAEGAGYENAFGWYNLGDDVQDPANRHVIFECDVEPQQPFVTRRLDFCAERQAGRWRGGPIGFFLLTPERRDGNGTRRPNCAVNDNIGYVYFSEPRLNQEDPNNPYIHHLVYRSNTFDDSFYFGFEDLFRGGDNDFEDTLVLVQGLLVGEAPEVCDGQDDDCDGRIDEGADQLCQTACGEGIRACVGAALQPCTAPEPGEEDCDGVDDDCDGTLDEGLTRPCENACGQGVEACVAGDWAGCTAPPAGAEQCNNVDDDCDGIVDEALTAPCANGCGAPGTARCVAGRFVECDAPPPVDERCNGADDDCDGNIDEGIVEVCDTACGRGLRACADGAFGACSAPEPAEETCNGLDDDCDGTVDEVPPIPCGGECGQLGEAACVGGAYVACSARTPQPERCDGQDNDCDDTVDEALDRPCRNRCGEGREICAAGAWSACDAPTPTLEVCDAVDNDCDGTVDENLAIVCETECGRGLAACADGAFGDCSVPDPAPETCNGVDDDCDGTVDELPPRPCDAGCGDVGEEQCVGGVYVGCSATQPRPEACNGLDDDCDGETDEALVLPCESACGAGSRVCIDGAWAACDAPVPAQEVCDGEDNDCDGNPDEALAVACETGCGRGLRRCVAGEFGACSAPEPAEEVCNGADDDCDGNVDEIPPRPCDAGCGDEGVEQCIGGVFVGCSGRVPRPELCNGADDDCDGQTDEAVAVACESVCGAGRRLCVDGAFQPCDAPQPEAEVCDDADNDCDGEVDEGLVQACESDCGPGLARCVEGAFVECDAPQPGEEVCNGVDDDCDGAVDELPPRACDFGCGEGQARCVGGAYIGCSARAPVEELCNGVDDDCDGETDEGLTRACESACGEGVQRCEEAAWTACDAALPEPETCDGLDNDCDGGVDEALTLACRSACGDGVQTCVGGLYGECDAAEPIEETCNLADDDCDGAVDELLEQACDSVCGIGTELCIEGEWTNCSANEPVDELCNGEDDDCDGLLDEALIRPCATPCGEGMQVCENAGWTPCPSPEAQPEICDGGDNDCDGITDEEARCADEAACIRGQCVLPCIAGECGAGSECEDDYCIPLPCASCRPYEECVNDVCVDPCAAIDCPAGEYCRTGQCEVGDCYVGGCDDGRVCVGGECVPDACALQNCAAGQGCRDGVCFATCVDAPCAEGQRCAEGVCVDDPCAGVECGDGEMCRDGACVADGCDGPCGVGRLCVDGACADDPCLTVDCNGIGECRVDERGAFECYVPPAPPRPTYEDEPDADVGPPVGAEPRTPTPASGCRAQPGEAPTPWWAGALLLLGLARRRRLWLVALCALVGWGCEPEVTNVDRGDAEMTADTGCLPVVETCNGVDDDCNGVVDDVENLSTDPANCGACGNACDLPNAEPSCLSGQCRIRTCAPGYTNLDGQAENGCEAVCEASEDGVEICNEADDDCDGAADEGFDLGSDVDNCGVCGRSCLGPGVAEAECIAGRCSIAACEEGRINLDGRPENGCEYDGCAGPGADEECNGADDDCDGRIDEALDAPPCLAAGICRGVRATCRGEEGWSCPYPEAYAEGAEVRCDGLDEDCDGAVDEDFPGLGEACDGDDEDVCLNGLIVCSPDRTATVCREVQRGREICDGVDNDCDEAVDEGYDLQTDPRHCGACGVDCARPNADSICDRGQCVVEACAPGFIDRDGDAATGCEYPCAGAPGADELCNGLDDDCDGRVDEAVVPPDDVTCLTDGLCAGVRPLCTGAGGFECPYPEAFEEEETTCDGSDNDCDGTVDEGFGEIGALCDGDDADACQGGVIACSADGSEAVCTDDAAAIAEVCDGADNDCDGTADEGFDLATDPRHCGACNAACVRPEAEAACVDGACVIQGCAEGYYDLNGLAIDGCEYACDDEAVPEVCDGVDNDCDDSVDEGLSPPPELECLTVGVCAGAQAACRGAEGFGCGYPPEYEPDGETLCDSLDNDCDGLIDEDFVGIGTLCDGDDDDACASGIIACAADGAGVACTDDAASVVEACDGGDNDCDGETDEGFDTQTDPEHCGRCNIRCERPGGETECVDGECVLLGCREGFYDLNGLDIDGCEFACAGDASPEVCDGIDNDCDESLDEGLDPPADLECLDVGVCGGASAACLGPAGFGCDYPPTYEAGDEVSCDGLDNDCDGETDEGFGPIGALCDGDDDDLCTGGIVACAPDGNGVICTDDDAAVVDVCDGADNDCDGEADEGIDLAVDLEHCGACNARCERPGSDTVCVDGDCVIQGCRPGFYDLDGDPINGCEYDCPGEAGDEVCDGVDNDCDGTIDEEVPPPDDLPCLGEGVCAGARVTCLGERGFACGYPVDYEPDGETRCDGLDNDCDGTADEDFGQVGELCDSDDDDLCIGGIIACAPDGDGVVCTDDAASIAEVCDGADNDCDDAVDEGIDLQTDPENCGACNSRCDRAGAETACEDGACVVIGCEPGRYDANGLEVDGCEYACEGDPSPEICDGLDNDCDSEIDEDAPLDALDCDGPGLCAGLSSICGGAEGEICPYPPAYEAAEVTCDDLDNDCDGTVDEGGDNPAIAGKSQACAAGVGACRRAGVNVCDADGAGLRCTAVAGDPTPETCNGVDDDCDGRVDEDIPRADEMVRVQVGNRRVWIDRWEASRPDATAQSIGLNTASACSAPGVLPWTNIDHAGAAAACAARGKRLCTDEEWATSCGDVFPYGNNFRGGRCNTGTGNVLPTGARDRCVSPSGALDMSGNVAEWADCADPVNCQVVRPALGGSFADSVQSLWRCDFRGNSAPLTRSATVGFRCCQDN